ncbi:MAG: hypothetical protein Q4E64_02090 [Phascolarctobacterium sp.]|uniref:hypothetical protein n=1 Tax=Phascolarctobacterium sp. TaxID=2049039 RepID=UPI0026DBB938|nr:hypothetical protein [Phascolarctobacterium sp.]MDO4920605.1 hypothetical protein [Phascolarctobacterium sp.]
MLKYRFSDEVIEKLLKIKWWNWDDDKIKESFSLWYSPEKFIRYYGEQENI